MFRSGNASNRNRSGSQPEGQYFQGKAESDPTAYVLYSEVWMG